VILILLHFSRGDDSSVLPHHTSIPHPTTRLLHLSLPANHVLFLSLSLSLSLPLSLSAFKVGSTAVSEQNFYDNRLKDSKLTGARRADRKWRFVAS
jgi:hypothetical protein